MNSKITPEHLGRGAVVYIRQSTLGQVMENTESQRRQYALAESASGMGFSSVAVIDDDLGRSGSGIVVRPGFQKLVANVCSGAVGAVFCIEASRLARNGRDWHHLVDLCAVVGVLVIDHDGVYDPRLVNDRLLLGLKGTMSEYELNLLRQRGLAARDSKAKRGELRFSLPPGYCWNDVDQIEVDPDERVSETIKLMFRKFRELGSARQLFLWARDAGIKIPVVRQNAKHQKLVWQAPAYHNLVEMMQNPIYAGAYAFGRRTHRVQVVDGRPRKTIGHRKPMHAWNVLIQDNHEGYISWEEFEENRQMLTENAYMQQRASRKAARWKGSTNWPCAMRSLWQDHACVLWNGVGPCASVSMPRRRCTRWRGPVHRNRRRKNRPNDRQSHHGGCLSACGRSRARSRTTGDKGR